MLCPVWQGGLVRSYVIAGKEGLCVVDPGSVGTAQDVAAWIRGRDGWAMEQVRLIVATHFHMDHIGGIASLLRQCPPGTRVGLHPLVAEYLAGRRGLSPLRRWMTAFRPVALASLAQVRRFAYVRVDSLAGIPLPGLRRWHRIPWDRERITYFGGPGFGTPGFWRCPLGFDAWEVLATPGHTEDSVSFFDPRTESLVCGDLVLNLAGDGQGRLNRFCWREDVLEETMHRLCRVVRVRAIYPGHGEPLLGEGNLLWRLRRGKRG